MENHSSTPRKKAKPKALLDWFKMVVDYRMARTRKHLLSDILAIAVLTYLCGFETYVDMEEFAKLNLTHLKRYLELPGGVPSHDTFQRVLQMLRPEALQKAFLEWIETIRSAHAPAKQVALDGKALRGAKKGKKGAGIPYIVSAWADVLNGLCLGQVKVPEKSNEIRAIPDLLEMLELKGCLVSIDAIGTNKQIAQTILNEKADYCLALKKNQQTLYEDVELYFEGLLTQKLVQEYHWEDYEQAEKGHGRKELRYALISHDVDWIEDEWPGLKAVGMVHREWEERGTHHQQTRYYILSRTMTAQDFLHAVRSHWGIENTLHWVLDVTFGEDRCRAKTRNADQNLALLRRLTYNLLLTNRDPKRSIRLHRMRCALDQKYMMDVLLGKVKPQA